MYEVSVARLDCHRMEQAMSPASGPYADHPIRGNRLQIKAKVHRSAITTKTRLTECWAFIGREMTKYRSNANVAWCNIVPRPKKVVMNAYKRQDLWLNTKFDDALAKPPIGSDTNPTSQSDTAILRITRFAGNSNERSIMKVRMTIELSITVAIDSIK